MADPAHLALARQGHAAWNNWRAANPAIPADFSGAVFTEPNDRPISFAGFNFGDGANFNGAVFGDLPRNYQAAGARQMPNGGADFAGAQFGERASFKEAQFGRAASFHRARFEKSCSFVKATFGDGVTFEEAHFVHAPSFNGAVFGRHSIFRTAGFGPWATFERCKFEDGASFGGTNVFHEISFSRSEFTGSVEFRNRVFQAATDFSHVRFCAPPDFTGTRHRERLDFAGAEFDLRGEGWWPEASWHWPRHWSHNPETVTQLRRLRKMMQDIGANDTAHDLFVLERRTERGVTWAKARHEKSCWGKSRYGWKAVAQTALLALYGCLSDCGRSVKLPLFWLVVMNAALLHFFYYQIRSPLDAAQKPIIALEQLLKSFTLLPERSALSRALERLEALQTRIEQAQWDLWFAGMLPSWLGTKTAVEGAGHRLFGGLLPSYVQWAMFTQGTLNVILLFLVALALRNYFRVGGTGGASGNT